MQNNQISYKQELFRKSIHLCSLSMPLFYYYFDYKLTMQIIIPLSVLFISADILSKKITFIRNFVFKYFGSMLREHEKTENKFVLNGASWVLISAIVIFTIFPKILAVTSFIILIISDLSAALIGRRFGRNALFNKSWEGTSAFFITSSLIVYLIYLILPVENYYFLAFGIIASAVTAFVEAISKKLNIDDNISIPSAFCGLMWLLHPIAANNSFAYLNLM